MLQTISWQSRPILWGLYNNDVTLCDRALDNHLEKSGLDGFCVDCKQKRSLCLSNMWLPLKGKSVIWGICVLPNLQVVLTLPYDPQINSIMSSSSAAHKQQIVEYNKIRVKHELSVNVSVSWHMNHVGCYLFCNHFAWPVSVTGRERVWCLTMTSENHPSVL